LSGWFRNTDRCKKCKPGTYSDRGSTRCEDTCNGVFWGTTPTSSTDVTALLADDCKGDMCGCYSTTTEQMVHCDSKPVSDLTSLCVKQLHRDIDPSLSLTEEDVRYLRHVPKYNTSCCTDSVSCTRSEGGLEASDTNICPSDRGAGNVKTALGFLMGHSL